MILKKNRKIVAAYIIFCLLLFLLFAHTSASLVQWIFEITSHTDLDYAERWHAYVARQAYPQGNHVSSAYVIPHNVLPYPPICYLIYGWVGKLLGADLIGIRTIGRVTIFTMTILNAFLIFIISKRLQVKTLWSTIAALLFLCSSSSHLFAVSLRPDEMALTLSLLVLYTLLKYQNYWLLGGLFALIITTKHSYISLPIVIVISLLWQRNYLALLKIAISGLVLGLAVIFISNSMLGPYWWQGYFLQGFHSADIKQAIYFVGQGFKQPVLITGMASIFFIGFKGNMGIISASFLLSLGINSIALAKTGAAGNYFLEPVAFGAILTACLAKQFLDRPRWLLKGFSFTLLLALLIPSTVQQLDVSIKAWKGRNQTLYSQLALIETLKTVPEPILSDAAWVYFDSNHNPYNNPPDLVMAAVEGNKIDGTPMQQFIAKQGFKAIVVKNDWKSLRVFPEVWIAEIEKNYELVEGSIEKYNFRLMRPKSP